MPSESMSSLKLVMFVTSYGGYGSPFLCR
jgi:hypothetical protein